VLFADVFDTRDILEGIRRFRANTVLRYAVAIGWVAVATLLRFVIEGEVPDTVPFTTYSLTLIVASVFGGFWPGIAALILAALGGWFLFLPPIYSFAIEPKEMWALILFVIVGVINVSVLSVLMSSVLARDEHQQLLKRELQHRSQNLFAVIQAIASRSFVEGQTFSEAKQAFNARLVALSRTHAVLENNAWTGAPLKQIVLQELLGFANQITVTGCDIPLNTPAAQHFALIVHELSTNAVKHGALSSPEGRVEIEGKVEGVNGKGEFRFAWRESGGPPVTRPTRVGFGTAILLGTAKHFSENVKAEYAPEGLIYNLIVALNKIESSERKSVLPEETASPTR
jgi:two-component sensor histidine kinase